MIKTQLDEIIIHLFVDNTARDSRGTPDAVGIGTDDFYRLS